MSNDFGEFGTSGDEFFPLDDASIMNDSKSSSNVNLPGESGKRVKGLFGKTKSYFKNVSKSVRGITYSVAKDRMPNVVDFGQALADTAKAGQSKASEARQKAAAKIAESRAKSGSNNFGGELKATMSNVKNGIKRGITTGEFYKDPNDIDLSAMLGGDDDMDFGDFDFGGDDSSSSKASPKKSGGSASASAASSRGGKASANRILVKKSSPRILNYNGVSAKQMAAMTGAIGGSFAASAEASTAANMAMHRASAALSEMQFKQQMAAYGAIYGALEKMANFTVEHGSQDMAASMEYRAKSIAMQEDTLTLLKEMKAISSVGLSVNALIGMKDEIEQSEREKIFGAGFNGEEYFNNILSKSKAAFSNSTIGSLMDAGGMMGDMGEMTGQSKSQMAVNQIFGSIPGMFLSKKTKAKMSRVNDIFGSMGGAMTMKFNQMARYSDNPLVRGIASVLGVNDLMAKRVDHGVKDPAGKAVFSNAAHRSIVEVIPGFLAKLLAAQTGEEEIYYDMKSGAFKTASSAVKRYKYDEAKTFESSVNLNETQERMADAAMKAADAYGIDAKDINDDFKKIKENIIKTKMLFSPDLLMGKSKDAEEYRAFLGRGLKHADISLRMYADQFARLQKGDQLAFTTGLAEVLQNRDKFISNSKKDIEQYGAPASLVEHLEREDFDDRNTGLATAHINASRYKKGTNAELAARKARLDYEEKLANDSQGRVASYGGMYDRSGSASLSGSGPSVGDLASGYNEGKGPSAILSNIYNLLLDGIVVFPQSFLDGSGKPPKHIAKRQGSRFVNAKAHKELEQSKADKEREQFENLRKSRTDLRRTQKAQQLGLQQLTLGQVLGMQTTRMQTNNPFDRMFDRGSSALENFSHKFLLGDTKNAGEGSATLDELEDESFQRVQALIASGEDVTMLGMLRKMTEGKDGKVNSTVNSLVNKAISLREKLAGNAASWKEKIQASKEYQAVMEKAAETKKSLDKSVSYAKANASSMISSSSHAQAAKHGLRKAKGFIGDKTTKFRAGTKRAMHGTMFTGDYDSEIRAAISAYNPDGSGIEDNIDDFYADYMRGSAQLATQTPAIYGGSAASSTGTPINVNLNDVSLTAIDKLFGSKAQSNVPSIAQSSSSDYPVPIAKMAPMERARETKRIQTSSKTVKRVKDLIQKKYQETVDALQKVSDPGIRTQIINDFYRNTQTLLSSVPDRLPPSVRTEFDRLKIFCDKQGNTIQKRFIEVKSQSIVQAKQIAARTGDVAKEKAHWAKNKMNQFKDSAVEFYESNAEAIGKTLDAKYKEFQALYAQASSPEERAKLKEQFTTFMSETAPEKARYYSKKLEAAYKKTSANVSKTLGDLWDKGKAWASDKGKQAAEFASGTKAKWDARNQASATPAFNDGSTVTVYVSGFSQEALEALGMNNVRLRGTSKYRAALKRAKAMQKTAKKNKRDERRLRRAEKGKKGFFGKIGSGIASLGRGAGGLAAGGVRVGGGVVGGVFGGVGSFFGNLFGKKEIGLVGLLKEVKKGKRPFEDALAIVRSKIANNELDTVQGAIFLDKAVEMEVTTRIMTDKILLSWKKDKIISKEAFDGFMKNLKTTGGYAYGSGVKLKGEKIAKSKRPGFLANVFKSVGSLIGGAGGGGLNLASAIISKPLGALRNMMRKRVDQRYNDEKRLSGNDFEKIMKDINVGRTSLPSAINKLYEMMKRGQLSMTDLVFFCQELINHDESNSVRIFAIMDGWVSDGYLTKADLKKYRSNFASHGKMTYGLKDPNIFKRRKPLSLFGAASSVVGGAFGIAAGALKKAKQVATFGLNKVGQIGSWIGNKLKGGEREGSAADLIRKRSLRGNDNALSSIARDVSAIRAVVSKMKGFPMTKKELEKALKNGGGGGSGSDNNGGSGFRSGAGKFIARAGTVAGAGLIAAGAVNMFRGSAGAASKFGEASDMAAAGASGGEVAGHVVGADSSGTYDWQGNKKSGGYAQAVKDDASIGKAAQAAVGMKGITTAGRAIIKGSNKLGAKVAGHSNVLGKLTGFLEKMFMSKPFSNFIQKSMVGKLVKAIVGKLTGSALGKFAAKITSSIAKAMVPIGWAMIAGDFVSGMSQTSRYFRLPKGVAPNIWMRITSGIVNTLSGLLFGLLPPEIIAPMIYNIIASDETKKFLEEGKQFGADRAKILGVETDRLVEYETRPLGERLMGGDKKAAAQLGFGNTPEGVAAFKEWESKKYKPLMSTYDQLKAKFGGSVVEKEPRKPGDAELQKAFRKEYLETTAKFVKDNKLEDLRPGAGKGKTGLDDASATASGQDTEGAEKATGGSMAAAAAGAVGGGAGEVYGMTGDASGTPDTKSATSTSSSDGASATPSATGGSGATTAAAAATAGAGGAAGAAAATQGVTSNAVKSANAQKQAQPNASLAESPITTDAKQMTDLINEHLDAMKALLREQTRHNGSVEELLTDLKDLLIQGFRLDPAQQALDEARKKAAEDGKKEKENSVLDWLTGKKNQEDLTKSTAKAIAAKRGQSIQFDARTEVTDGT